MGSTLSERSSDNLFDFLLNFTLAGSAFEGAECAKRDEIDDRMTAIVWVSFPGFIVVLLRQREKDDMHLSLFSFTRTRMRVSRGEFGCAVKCSPNVDTDSD